MINKKRVDIKSIEEQAMLIVEEYGFNGLSIKNMAQNLHIKSPSLYNHIKNLSHLQEILIEKVLGDLNETLRTAAIGWSGPQALERMAWAYLKYAREHPKLYECILFIPGVYKESLSHKSGKILSLIYQVLDPVIQDKELQTLFVRGYRSLLHGFASLEAVGYFKGDVNPDKSFSYTMTHFINDFFERE